MKKSILFICLLSLAMAPINNCVAASQIVFMSDYPKPMSTFTKISLFFAALAAGYIGYKTWFKGSPDSASYETVCHSTPGQATIKNNKKPSTPAKPVDVKRAADRAAKRQEEARRERADAARAHREQETKIRASAVVPTPVRPVVIREQTVAVKQQTGGDCGFHAAYNAAKDDHLTDGTLEIMRKHCSASDTALMSEDIFTLMVQNFEMHPAAFTIVPNVNQLVPENGRMSAHFLIPILGKTGTLGELYQQKGYAGGIGILVDAINRLRTRPGAKHAFIIGNATMAYNPATNKFIGFDDSNYHWITVCAHNEDGVIVLSVKDSQAGNAGTPVMVDSLKKIISSVDTTLLNGQKDLLRADLR